LERAPFIPLGRIVKSHGLKGEVSVAPLTGPPFFMPEGLQVWLVPPPGSSASTTVESVRPGPKGPLVKLAGIDDIDAAKRLANCEILAREQDVPHEIDDDYFDVTGYAVVTDEGLSLGDIVETIVTGANDVWVVEGHLGEILLPVIDDVVLDIDDDAAVITVHLLPGLVGRE
jgi:16S rRNA processing protein RimM